MNKKSVHHVEIFAAEGFVTVQKFISIYPFQLVAERNGVGVKQWLVCCSSTEIIRFVFTQIDNPDEVVKDTYSVQWWKYEQEQSISEDLSIKQRSVSSVFNISLEINDVKSFYTRLSHRGLKLLKDVQSVDDENGYVQFFVVKSIVGNVTHTIIDSRNYHGLFLPGFSPVSSSLLSHEHHNRENRISHFDHFTFACHVGDSGKIIDWYENNFKMKRLFINR